MGIVARNRWSMLALVVGLLILSSASEIAADECPFLWQAIYTIPDYNNTVKLQPNPYQWFRNKGLRMNRRYGCRGPNPNPFTINLGLGCDCSSWEICKGGDLQFASLEGLNQLDSTPLGECGCCAWWVILLICVACLLTVILIMRAHRIARFLSRWVTERERNLKLKRKASDLDEEDLQRV